MAQMSARPDPNALLNPADRAKAAEVARQCLARAAALSDAEVRTDNWTEREAIGKTVAAWLEAAERADKIARGPL